MPDGWRVYVIGDIHGRADLLDQLLTRIDAERPRGAAPQSLYVFLGDYVDRGPDSKAVIERIIGLSRRRNVACLKGNHEAFLLEFFTKPDRLQDWGRYGGLTTLMAYGLRPPVQPSAAQCA